MFDSPREMESLLEERCGRVLARVTLWAVVLGTISAGLLAALTLTAWINNHVVTRVPLPQPSLWTEIAISVAITVVMLAATVYASRRWVHGREQFFVRTLSKYFDRFNDRLKHVEANAADFSTTKDNFDDLAARVSALESHTDIGSARDRLHKLIVEKLTQRELGN
jgi:hypothetical protein